MNYTTEEQQLIDDAAKENAMKVWGIYYADVDEDCHSSRGEISIKDFKRAFGSITMQQIIESRVKAAKIEVLKEVAKEYNQNSFSNAFTRERKFKSVGSVILDKIKELTELTK
jgi:hypothetical protein